MRRLLSLALGALLLALATPPRPAAAHAVLVEARPADGERLDAAPAEVTLRFDEPVVPVAVRLLDAAGAEVPGVVVEGRGETVMVRPPAPLPRGAYLLSYRVTSVDTHPVAATLRFGVGVDPAAGGSADAAPDPAVRWAGGSRAGWSTSPRSAAPGSPCSCFWSGLPGRSRAAPCAWALSSRWQG